MKIAILAGGLSNEREVSMWTSEQIAAALKEKHQVSVIEVNPDGKWISELQATKPEFVFIALHGKFGEDGKVQSVLELLGIPYNGSGVTASAIAFDKVKANQFLHAYGVFAPKFLTIVGMPKDLSEIGKVIHEHIGYPCVIKPNESGSSFGVTILEDPTKLAQALEIAFKEDSTVIVQQYVKGREPTCGIIGNSGQMQSVAMPLVEIVPKSKFFDFQEKYKTTGNEICPAQVPQEVSKKVQELSKIAHEALGCRGLTRSDFIWVEESAITNKTGAAATGLGQIYFLEVNTLPGQTPNSLCPKMAAAMGISFADFIENQIKLGMIK